MPYANVEGTRLWYSDAGHGPALVLVHGFPLDSRVWDGLLPYLTPHRRVICVDQRGFGKSDDVGAFSMKQLACDIIALVRSLNIAPCAMAGLSMGGYVLQEVARQAPEVLKHLILIDTKSESDTPEGQNKRNALAKLAEEKGARAVAEQMLPNMLSPDHDPEVAQRLMAIMTSQRPKTLASASIAMRDREDFVTLLTQLDMPVDIIVGQNDAITPPLLARAMHEKLKNGRLFEIEKAGHMSPFEQPAAVAEALLKLSDGCPS
jgi:pimeloyl-ACP methyl ester carboxylesterase